MIFGGIENSTRKVLDDVIVWDVNTLKMIRPFVSGMNPGPVNGHGICLMEEGDFSSIFVIGGVNDIF